MNPKFPLGQIVATPAALSFLRSRNLSADTFIARHAHGDWGDLCDDDRQSNEDAVVNGEQLLSSYKISDFDKVWVITEWDRSVTTLLLPEDY